MDLSEQVLVTLRQIMRAASIHSKRLMQGYGLSIPQLLILSEIKRAGEIPTGVLSQRVSLSPATVTSIIDRLKAKGLVERVRSASDRRKVLVHLTEAGNQKVENAPDPLQEEFQARFESLEPWEQTLILSSLQRVAGMMKAQHIEASPVLSSEEFPPI